MAANTDDTADVKAVTLPASDMATEGTGAALDRDAAAAVGLQDDGSVSAGVAGVVRSAVDGVERAARSLSRRVVENAATRRPPIADRDALAKALSDRPPAPALAGATAAAVAVRLLSRFKAVKIVAKKSPMWLLVTAVPALLASVSRGADELGMVASHLVHRARAVGVEPDLERVRRASVQIVSHLPVDPEVEPSHGRLAVGWLKRAARAALPFTAGVATADPEGLAAAASELDPTLLGPS
jgi:hypothetical protein